MNDENKPLHDRRSMRERMLTGDLYIADDPQIAAELQRAAILMHRFNTSVPHSWIHDGLSSASCSGRWAGELRYVILSGATMTIISISGHGRSSIMALCCSTWHRSPSARMCRSVRMCSFSHPRIRSRQNHAAQNGRLPSRSQLETTSGWVAASSSVRV
jgi:hypothetical protein